jgi:Leucine-rich repeat (LRR) protein
MIKTVIDCKNLTKTQINEQIENKTRGLESIELRISNYEYNDFVGIKLNIVNMNVFSCRDNKITSFEGLKLNPDSLLEFYCSDNQITSFTGLILPNSLTNFYCSYNRITSYFVADGLAGLKLPSSLTKFNCSDNKITSFAGLKLPNSLTEFYCSDNQITSFTGLVLPNSLIRFDCFSNQIKVIEDFKFPSSLQFLLLDMGIKFIKPKFNSVIKSELKSNNVEFESLDNQQLVFLYLNFDLNYQQYDKILNKLSGREY